MKKKILTIDQLISFCEEQKFYNFSSEKTGYQLAVQIPATFETEESDDETMLYCNVKLLHTGVNRNGSCLTEKAAKKLIKSGFAYAPILANFTEDEDGNVDFTSHDFLINEDGEIEYIERQVGCFTTKKPYMEQDPDHEDRQYIYGQAAIPVEYTKAAEIIRRKNGSKISAEIGVNEMSYDAEERTLLLDDVVLLGATCLGVDPFTKEPIEEGMQGATIQIEDFSQENNSTLSHYSVDDKLIETLEKLNDTLSNFNIDNDTQKGGLNVFEKLLEKYDKTIDDIEFEYEGLSDEELEAKFAEVFDNVDEIEEDESEGSDEDPVEEDVVIDDDVTEESKKIADEFEIIPESYAVIMTDGTVKEFAVSLQDQISALTMLVNETYGEADNCWYDVIVYEKNLVMSDWWTGKSYRQDYKVRSDVYSLVGDRVPVHSIYVTDDEEKALDDLKGNFASVSAELDKYHAAEEKAKKEELMNSESYKAIVDKDEFKSIDIETFSVEELISHLDEILLKYAKEGNLNFASESEDKPEPKKLFGIPSQKTKGRYGSIFKKNK